MQLTDFINARPCQRVRGMRPAEVSGVTQNARSVGPGIVFVVPESGLGCNPYAAIAAADRGASAIICGPGTRLPHQPVPCIQVSDSRLAFAHAAAVLAGHPSRQIKIVGVRGSRARTVGRTLQQLLESSGLGCAWLGSDACEIGGRVMPEPVGSLDASQFQGLLTSSVNAGQKACVIELDSGLEATRLMSPITVTIDVDAELQSRATTLRMISHGNLFARELRLQPEQTGFRLSHGTEDWGYIHTAILGRTRIEDLLIAATGGLALGLSRKDLVQGIGSLLPVAGSMQPVRAGQPFLVTVDSAESDTSLTQVLRDARELARGRVLLVFGTGKRHAPWQRVELGRVAGGLADLTWLTTDDPMSLDPSTIMNEVARGLSETSDTLPIFHSNRSKAIHDAIRGARPGDVVVIAGKGFRRTQSTAGVCVPFDDGSEALDALAQAGWIGNEWTN